MTRNLWEYHWWISVCKRCFTLWKSELGKQRSGKNTTIFSVLPRLLFTKYIFQSLPLRQIDWKESNLRADYTIRSFVFHILHTLIDRVALKRADFWFRSRNRLMGYLSTESVKGLALSFQSIDNVKSSDSFSLGVFSVGDWISDNIFKEYLEDTTSFFVD